MSDAAISDILIGMEEWRPVVGYEGRYEVSDLGRVRTLVTYRRWKAGRILKTSLAGKGYHSVGLWKDGTRHPRYVHHLVAEAFIGERPEGQEACHDDGDKDNNDKTNVRYDTPSGNNLDKRRHGTSHVNVGSAHAKAKLTDSIVLAARLRRAEYGTSYELMAESYGINPSTMRKAVAGKTWTHLAMPGEK